MTRYRVWAPEYEDEGDREYECHLHPGIGVDEAAEEYRDWFDKRFDGSWGGPRLIFIRNLDTRTVEARELELETVPLFSVGKVGRLDRDRVAKMIAELKDDVDEESDFDEEDEDEES